MSSTAGRHRAGFTLMELIVAMSVFSIVMTGVYSAFRDAATMWRENEQDADVFQQARIAMSVMERDLRSLNEESAFFFEGTSAGRSGRYRDEMTFYTVVPPMLGRERRVPRLLKVTYYLKSERGRGFVLRRREQVVQGPMPRKKDFARHQVPSDQAVDLSRQDYIELAEHLESMRFRYFWPNLDSDNKWRDDCRPGEGPPGCVQIEFVFSDPNRPNGKKTFMGGVAIMCEPGPGPIEDSPL